MKKLIFTAIMALFSCVAFGQVYNIKFKVDGEATEKLGTDWDYSFQKAEYNPPYYVEFDGTVLKVSNGVKDYLNVKADKITVKDKKKTSYGKEVIIGKSITIGVNNNDFWNYYILKYNYFESGGYYMLLYCPFTLDDGTVFAYRIFESEVIK